MVIDCFMIVFQVSPDQALTYRDGLEHLAHWGDADQRGRAEELLAIHPTAEDIASMLESAKATAAALETRGIELNKLVADDPDPAPGMGMDWDDRGLD